MDMGAIEQPERACIKELPRSEIETILGRNHVGRIAFSFHDRVDMRPIHYVYKNGWIYGCTSKGGKPVFRIHLDEATGRQSTPTANSPKPQ